MHDTAIPALVFFLMFIIGVGLTPADFKRIRHQPIVILSATAGQLLLLPLAAWLLIKLLQPAPAIATGMLLIALCPGGAVSNFYCFLARANTALSVTLTAVSSLLAALLLPQLVSLVFSEQLPAVAESQGFALRLTLQLLLLLVSPVLFGMCLRWRFPRYCTAKIPLLERLGALALLLLLAVIFIQHRQQIVENLAALLVAATLFSMLSIAIACLQCRLLSLTSRDGAAIIIEYPVRNLALAAMIAVTLFGSSEYVLFAAIFFVVQTPIIIGLILWYRRRLSADDKYLINPER